MIDSYVCSGAMMKCTMGTSPAKLTVLPNRMVFLAGQLMANISDNKTMVNLAPFGLCRSLAFPPTASATSAAMGTLTPMPCMHNTPAPWMGGKMDYLIKGQPALLQSCKCQCMWGGTISLINNGQIGEGAQGVTEKKGTFNGQENYVNQIQLNDIFNVQNSLTRMLLISRLRKYSDEQRQWITNKANEHNKSGLNTLDSFIKAEHDLAFINSKKSDSMDDNQADLTHSNPKYGLSDQFGINCATTTTAFMLRKQGYDVVARARNANEHTNAIAYGLNIYDAWRNPDGSHVSPTLLSNKFYSKIEEKGLQEEYDKLIRAENVLLGKKQQLKQMLNTDEIAPSTMRQAINSDEELQQIYQTYQDSRQALKPIYKEILMEACEEEGYYTFGLVWESVIFGGGHYTVIKSEKDEFGNTILTNIEPQNGDPFQDIDTLIDYLGFPPDMDDSILRTDDKVFNVEYNDLFDINN